MLKNFKKTKIKSEKNKIQVSVIKNELRDLRKEITNMSEEEKKIRKTK